MYYFNVVYGGTVENKEKKSYFTTTVPVCNQTQVYNFQLLLGISLYSTWNVPIFRILYCISDNCFLKQYESFITFSRIKEIMGKLCCCTISKLIISRGDSKKVPSVYKLRST